MIEEEARYVKKANKKKKATKVREGFRVYIRARTPPKKSPKLYPKWEGPYRVLKDHGRNRFLVKNLISGQEKVVHADHVKIVPETMTDVSMNPQVKLPHPGLSTGVDSREEEELDDIVFTFPPSTDWDSGQRGEDPANEGEDANLGETGREHREVAEDSQPESSTQVRQNERAKTPYGLRPRVKKPNYYGR